MHPAVEFHTFHLAMQMGQVRIETWRSDSDCMVLDLDPIQIPYRLDGLVLKNKYIEGSKLVSIIVLLPFEF